MGLAAAERGLELDDRLASPAGDPPQGLDHQPAHPLGEVGAGEELDRVLVLGLRPAARHLREVRRELGLPVAAGGDVGMRPRHLPPRPQALPGNGREHAGRRPTAPSRREAPRGGTPRRVTPRSGAGAPRRRGSLVRRVRRSMHGIAVAPRHGRGHFVHQARSVGSIRLVRRVRSIRPVHRRRRPLRAVAHRARQRPQALRGLRVHLLDEPRHGVEGAPRILVRHVHQPGVRPLVPRRDQLLDPGAVLAAELAPEEVVPVEVHQQQAAGGVEAGDQRVVLAGRRQVAPLALVEHVEDPPGPPLVGELRAQLPRDVGREHCGKRLQPLGDALVVGGGHRILRIMGGRIHHFAGASGEMLTIPLPGHPGARRKRATAWPFIRRRARRSRP